MPCSWRSPHLEGDVAGLCRPGPDELPYVASPRRGLGVGDSEVPVDAGHGHVATGPHEDGLPEEVGVPDDSAAPGNVDFAPHVGPSLGPVFRYHLDALDHVDVADGVQDAPIEVVVERRLELGACCHHGAALVAAWGIPDCRDARELPGAFVGAAARAAAHVLEEDLPGADGLQLGRLDACVVAQELHDGFKVRHDAVRVLADELGPVEAHFASGDGEDAGEVRGEAAAGECLGGRRAAREGHAALR